MNSSLIEALVRIVGRQWVRHRRADLATYAMDGLPTHESIPGVVIMPGSPSEVREILRLLHLIQVPFVARGAGTGLSGGALAESDAVLITLTRMNRILRVDPIQRRAVVQPGVVNARLSEAVAPLGLQYVPDPSSQAACTVGGNVAENAGGPHCLKYGVTTNHIVSLEVVLPDGSATRLGSDQGEAWGPDLVGLFVGSEGMFGIATEITVRLEQIPESVRTMLADFTAVRAASEAVSAIIAAGIVPAALEMMDKACVAAVEASIYAAGYPTDAAAVLLVELDGQTDAVGAE
ncbi:MAG: FAD-binding protein, partial [Gemmatimonadota bacterium]|nr:FAD-binding protein [Gemmatimonadota bacterium]